MTPSEPSGGNAPPPGYVFVVSDANPNPRARVNVGAVMHHLWRRKFTIALGTLIFVALAGAYAYRVAKPVYMSSMVVVARQDARGAGLAGISQQLGGLASLAGVNIGPRGSAEERVATLSSRWAAEELARRNDIVPVLFPPEPGLFGLRPYKAPTLQAATEAFMKNVRRIQYDNRTGIITVSMRMRDRMLAAKWAADLVDIANERLKAEAIRDAQQNIDFLKREGQQATLDSVRQAIVSLMEANMNEVMLANVQSNYAFRVIDPPVPPEVDDFVSPNRPQILLLGFLLGFCAMSALVLWPHRKSLQRPPAGEFTPSAMAIPA